VYVILYSQGNEKALSRQILEDLDMKTYKETKAVIKDLVVKYGLDGITGYHIRDLQEQGHTGTNIQNAIGYFQYSPRTACYRK
jgi:hypothetical protein